GRSADGRDAARHRTACGRSDRGSAARTHNRVAAETRSRFGGDGVGVDADPRHAAASLARSRLRAVGSRRLAGIDVGHRVLGRNAGVDHPRLSRRRGALAAGERPGGEVGGDALPGRRAGGRLKAFADLYAALDATTKTNEKIEALTQYLKTAPSEDAIWGIAFLIGRRPKR